MSSVAIQEVERLESKLAGLQEALTSARGDVQTWTDSNADLSRKAAEARAKNQGAGTGVLGAFLGAKFRSAMRSSASASNAAIARNVAQSRSEIAAGKALAQERVKAIQASIAETKQLIREAKTTLRESKSSGKARTSSVELLIKLKEAHSLGLLTDEEFEEKRARLVSEI